VSSNGGLAEPYMAWCSTSSAMQKASNRGHATLDEVEQLVGELVSTVDNDPALRYHIAQGGDEWLFKQEQKSGYLVT
jgi:hypothetical protein